MVAIVAHEKVNVIAQVISLINLDGYRLSENHARPIMIRYKLKYSILTVQIHPKEIKSLEDKVNEVIAQDLPVKEKFINYEIATKQFDLTRLPEAMSEDLRIIEIGDYDSVPCIGPHIKSTKELGQFKIISSDFDNGVLRIRYKLA